MVRESLPGALKAHRMALQQTKRRLLASFLWTAGFTFTKVKRSFDEIEWNCVGQTNHFMTKWIRGIAYGQIAACVLLLIPEVIGSHSAEWTYTSIVFGVLSPVAAVFGLASSCQITSSSYRLFQLVQLCISLTLLPGCGFATIFLSRMIEETNKKLSQPSWTANEVSEESFMQKLRYAGLFGYNVMLVMHSVGGFINCVMLWKFPDMSSSCTGHGYAKEDEAASRLLPKAKEVSCLGSRQFHATL